MALLSRTYRSLIPKINLGVLSNRYKLKQFQAPVFYLIPNCRSYTSEGSEGTASAFYRQGFVVVSLPLPSRDEQCEFTMRPVTDKVKDLVDFIKEEDGGIERATIYNMAGTRISNSTPIEMLMQQDFKLLINERSFDVIPPKEEHVIGDELEQFAQLKTLVNQLYIDLNIPGYQEQREKELLKRREALNSQLQHLEEAKKDIQIKADKRTNMFVWAGLGYMAIQFGFLARLTWWEYSWDIMEPVTYFVTYLTSMAAYAYFVLTRQEYLYPDARNRQFLLSFHKEGEKVKFDLPKYNALKELLVKVDDELDYLRSPQFKLPASAEVTVGDSEQSSS